MEEGRHKELVVKALAEQADGMYVNYFMFVMPVSIVKQVPLRVWPVRNPTGVSSV
jgi:hypothetical protein